MSYANFKPLIWSKHIEHELPKFTVFKNDCDFKFEGEVKKGKRVKILGVGRPTIKDYIPGTDIDSPEIVPDTSIFIDIDQYKYFSYGIDNIDKAQAKEGIMQALAQETTRAIAELEDSFIAKEVATGAGYKTQTTKIATTDEAKAIVDKLFVKLWSNGVSSKDNLTLYISPWFYDLFESKIVELKTQNDALIGSGVLGKYRGANIKMSNNLYNDGTDEHVILKTSKGYAYVNGIDELKAFSPEKSFSDAVKGLNTFGGKAVRPKEIVVAKIHQ